MARKNKDEDLLGKVEQTEEEKKRDREARRRANEYAQGAVGVVQGDRLLAAAQEIKAYNDQKLKQKQAESWLEQYYKPIYMPSTAAKGINEDLLAQGLPGVFSSDRAVKDYNETLAEGYRKMKQYESPIYMPSSAAKDVSADLEAQGLPGVFTSRTVYQPIENKAGEYYKRRVRDVSNEMSRIDDRISQFNELNEELETNQREYDNYADSIYTAELAKKEAGEAYDANITENADYQENHARIERINEILADPEFLRYKGDVGEEVLGESGGNTLEMDKARAAQLHSEYDQLQDYMEYFNWSQTKQTLLRQLIDLENNGGSEADKKKVLEKLGWDREDYQNHPLYGREYRVAKNIWNDEELRKNREKWEAEAEEHPLWSSAKATLAKVGGTFTGLAGVFLDNGERNHPFYTYLNNYAGTVQDTVQKNIEEDLTKAGAPEFVAKGLAYGYAGVMAFAESSMALGLGKVTGVSWLGEALLGTGAGVQAYQSALANGYSGADAIATGVMSGLIETLTEHVSLENLRFLKATAGLKNLPLNLVKSFITEGSEEIASDILSAAWDYFAHGGLSEYERFVTRYVDEHKDEYDSERQAEEAARRAYAKDFGMQLLESGIIGGISGLFGAEVMTIVNETARLGSDYLAGKGYQEIRDKVGSEETYNDLRKIADKLAENSSAREGIAEKAASYQNFFGEKQGLLETVSQGRTINDALAEMAENGNENTAGAYATILNAANMERARNRKASKDVLGRSVSDQENGKYRKDRDRAYLTKVSSFKTEGRGSLTDADVETYEGKLHEAGYGERNAKSTAYQVRDLLDGKLTSDAAERLLGKKGVTELVRAVMTDESMDADTRLYATKNILKTFDIAGEGNADTKNAKLDRIAALTGLDRAALTQYYADGVTREIRTAAKRGEKTDVKTVRADMDIDGAGVEVRVGDVTGIEDGELLLNTDREGETVKLGDVDLEAYQGGDEAAELYTAVKRYMTGGEGFSVQMSAGAANVMIAIAQQQPDGARITDDLYRAYAAGKRNLSWASFERSYSATERALRASEEALKTMYEVGSREKESKPGVERIGTAELSSTQIDELQVLDAHTKDTGIHMVITDELFSRRDGDIADLAGEYDGKNVIVPLFVDNVFTGKREGNVVLLAADHETVHRIRQMSEDLYQYMRERALRLLRGQLGEEGYNAAYAEYEKKYAAEIEQIGEDAVRDYIEEEIVAQYVGACHTRAFCEQEVKKNPRVWEKIKEVFGRIVESIKAKLGELAKHDVVVKAAMEADLYDVQMAYNLLEDALQALRMLGPAKNSAMAAEQSTEADVGMENKKTAEAVEKHSRISEEILFSQEDIQKHREIFLTKRSVNEFTEEELRTVEKWAELNYGRMKTVSPFFRAWFGEWRAHSTDPVMRVDLKNGTDFKAGKAKNKDTNVYISWGDQIKGETKIKYGSDSEVFKALEHIEEIVKKAILFDSESSVLDSKSKMPNTAFFHSYYAVMDDPERSVYKLVVEEAVNNKYTEDFFRGYELQSIKKVGALYMGVHSDEGGLTQQAPTINTIADLYAFVKENDEGFHPGRDVDPIFLDKHGMPRVFYHGTDETFTAFDITKSRSWEGSPDYDLPGFYFAMKPELAGDYGEGVHPYYLTAEKIWRTSKDGDLKSLQKKYGTYRAAYDELVRQGYDCVYVDDAGIPADERDVIVLKPENIKSAETGTERANVGTFSRYSDDTKFSRVAGAEAAEYAEKVKNGNPLNRARLELVQEAAEDIGAFEDGDLTAAQAAYLARKYNLSGNENTRKGIARALIEARNELKKGNTVDSALYILYETMKEQLEGMGGWMETGDSTVQEAKRFIRGQKIYMSEQDLNEVAENYGGRAALRRATFGKFNLTTDRDKGTTGGLDAFWDELLEQHFGFTETTDNVERVRQLLEIWSREDRVWMVDKENIPVGQTLEEAAGDKAIEALKDILYAGRKATKSEQERMKRIDVLTEELGKQREQGIHDALKENEAEYRRKLDALEKSDMELFQMEREKEKLENERKIEAIRKAYQQRADALERQMRENVERQQLLRDIHRNMSSLGKLVVNAKDTDHVPEALKTSVLHFVKQFAKGDRNVFTPAMARDLSHAYGMIERETLENGEMNPLFRGYDEDIAADLKELNEKIAAVETSEGRQIHTGLLSVEDLRTVARISEHILAVVRNANTMFIDGKRVEIDTMGQAAIDETGSKKRSFVQKKLADNPAYDFLTGKMLTPIWFFNEKLGGTFGRLYEGFRDAQDTWYRRVKAGREALTNAKETYHYDDWQDDKKHFYFTNATTDIDGKVFDADLTVDDMLQIYATYRRETENGQESAHLTGGIVLSSRVESLADRLKRAFTSKENRLKALSEEVSRRAQNEKFELSVEQLMEIINSLTDEQKAYADEIVRFMSTETSSWGNEASMELYGYRKFLEKYYFPYQSAENYLFTKLGTTNDARLKSTGFSKKLVHGAKTPLVISGFTEVAAAHIQEMAMYASFLNPIENFTRVYNYANKETGKSVKSELGSVYGKGATEYISNFITNVNGGMRSDRTDSIWNKGTSLFKKAAVMANMSVIVQQPTALLRATAMINPVYFGGLGSPGTLVLRGADYKDMMEHSEIAGIKQMGGFDTGLGQNATDWMLDEKSWKERLSDLAGTGAEWADAVTWTNIWNAVKRETRAKYKDVKVGSDEFYEICRKRFRDICDYTQVYDSSLSKSALMQSKAGLTKMVTAFMAEPTLSFNLITQSGRGRTIHKGRALVAFVANMLVNAAFQSIVGAWRKKEEDETYLEKYVRTFTGNFLGSKDVWFADSALSPVTMIPWVKDLLSIAQGYDVERSDVSVFTDLISAVQDVIDELKEGNKPTFDEILALGGVLSAFGPVPITKAVQDVQGIIRTIDVWKKDTVHNTAQGVKNAFLKGIGVESGKADKAYNAVLNGDAEYLNRQRQPDEAKIAKYEEQGYSHEDAVKKAENDAATALNNLVKEGLIKNDPRVQEAAESRLNGDYDNYELLLDQMIADGFGMYTVRGAVESVYNKLLEELGPKEYEEKEKEKKLYLKSDFENAVKSGNVDDMKHVWDALTEQGTKESTIVGYMKVYYVDALEAGDTQTAEKLRGVLIDQGVDEKKIAGWAKGYAEIYFEESGMDREKTEAMLTGQAGMTEEAAEQQAAYWAYKIEYPEGSLDKDGYQKYVNEVQPLGISVEIYEQYDALMKQAKGTDQNGDGKTDSGSLKKAKMAAIDSLPISKTQKDELYRLNGWAESKIGEAPWRR